MELGERVLGPARAQEEDGALPHHVVGMGTEDPADGIAPLEEILQGLSDCHRDHTSSKEGKISRTRKAEGAARRGRGQGCRAWPGAEGWLLVVIG